MYIDYDRLDELMDSHERVALQFSGGKDSILLYHVLKRYLGELTVYHLDTGDEDPEVSMIVDRVACEAPNFVKIQSDVLQTRARYGLPTDLLPWSSSIAAHGCNAGATLPLQDRVMCCFNNIMVPLHQRMVKDEITLIFRGQKTLDKFKGPFSSGTVVDGITFEFPLEGMSDAEVFELMDQERVHYPDFYKEGLVRGGDCLTCTAWVTDQRLTYLEKHYPAKVEGYRDNLREIINACGPSFTNLIYQFQGRLSKAASDAHH